MLVESFLLCWWIFFHYLSFFKHKNNSFTSTIEKHQDDGEDFHSCEEEEEDNDSEEEEENYSRELHERELERRRRIEFDEYIKRLKSAEKIRRIEWNRRYPTEGAEMIFSPPPIIS